MRANQLRLWFASMAYVLLCALRRLALQQTQLAKATCGTHFPDYDLDELWRIFNHIVGSSGYQLSDSAPEAARARIAAIYDRKGDNFGNAREMRTLFEDVVQAQANRLASQTDISPEQFQVFERSDIGFPMGNLRLVVDRGIGK